MKIKDLKKVTAELYQLLPSDSYAFDELYDILKRLNAKARSYKDGELCYRSGDSATEIVAVVSGNVNVKLTDGLGGDILVRTYRPGEFVGLELLYGNHDVQPYDIVAFKDTVVIVFNVKALAKQKKDRRSQKLLDYLQMLLCKEFESMREKAAILGGATIAERLRRYLSIRMHKEHSTTLPLSGTEDQLANYLCVNKCAMSRSISQLRAEGKLVYKHRSFVITAPGAFSCG